MILNAMRNSVIWVSSAPGDFYGGRFARNSEFDIDCLTYVSGGVTKHVLGNISIFEDN